MSIRAQVESIRYDARMMARIPCFTDEDVRRGTAFRRGAFQLERKSYSYGVSHWVTPKRTRSYPYGRIYDTIPAARRVTIIPVCKDEGFDGDRDFIQWDSVSLMSLLGVYVVLAYYTDAKKSPRYADKITAQRFDTSYVLARLDELDTYHSDALHWNLSELYDRLPGIADLAASSYDNMAARLGVRMHDSASLRARVDQLRRDVTEFRDASRHGSMRAQERETQTVQPKEVTTGEKAKLTLHNYIGGEYRQTVDECRIAADRLFLIEKKHSRTARLPHMGDLKDGLVKMMLWTNLADVRLSGTRYVPSPVIGLTSSKVAGSFSSRGDDAALRAFTSANGFSSTEAQTLRDIVDEGTRNRFSVVIAGAHDETSTTDFALGR